MTAAVRRAAVLATLLLPMALPGVANADDASVFEVMTTAVGLVVSSTQQPAASVVTGGLVDTTVGYSSSALSSAGASASAAAAAYPGDLVAGGPSLLCEQFLPCPVTPPPYPLLAQASYPERPTAAADSTAPVGAGQASAAERSTAGRAHAATAAPGAPIALRVGAATTSTHAWVDAAGAHVRARSTLHDVVIGPLQVAVLDALDDVDVAPDGRVHDVPQVRLTGVTLAGQAAVVDDRGVHVPGHSQSLPDRELAAQGLAVRSIGTTRSDIPSAARSVAGGLQVTLSVPVKGAPGVPNLPSANRTYLASVTVGGVGAAVALGQSGSPLLSALPPATPSSLTARLLPPPSAGSAAGVLGGTTSPAAAPVLAPVAAEPVRRLLPQLDLRRLALALALGPLGLLLGWRLVVTVRRTAGTTP